MESTNAVNALGALAQETRLAIFRLLVEHGHAGLPAGRIADMLDLPPATLSFHLKALGGAGLITARPEGRFIYYRTDFSVMNGLIGYLTDNCCRASGACAPVCVPQSPPKQVLAPEAITLGKPTIRAKWRFA
jgi:ArsR family transcriptional regulator, arsenate/arsenite/antimonite-responsive transcriptional repressor